MTAARRTFLPQRAAVANAALPCDTAAMPLPLRLGDFAVRDGRIVLLSTGNSAAIDRALLAEVAIWVTCYLVVRVAALRHLGSPRPHIHFTPVVPHPRYMVRIAALWAGIRIASDPAKAVASFYFDDATTAIAPPTCHPCALNFGCTDIRKSHVAAVFERVFGYPLALDPATWHGAAVEKSEANGTHDGRIVVCPQAPAPGKVYQRVVDTVADGIATDLRTHVVGGRIVAVWIKRRTAVRRFQPANLTARLADPARVFTSEEIAAIEVFTAAMGADWAGLDILRDQASGRIYVVDVNKTDAGPIIALPFVQKLRSVALLGRALETLVA